MFSNVALVLFLLLSFDLLHAQVCLCDTSTACDILCCCDPECSIDDKTSFTCETTITTTVQPEVTCVSKNIFSKISPDDSFSFTKVNDNNCFTSTTITAPSSTKRVAMESSSIEPQNFARSFTFTNTFNNISSLNVTVYKVNDHLYLRDSSDISHHFTLPAGLRENCVRDSVLFLRNTTSSCSLKITNDVCQGGTKIDGTSAAYNDLSLVKNYRVSVSDVISVTPTCLNGDGDTIECKAPAVITGSCYNVLTRIDLVVGYGSSDGTNGLLSAELKLTLVSVSLDSVSGLVTTVHFHANVQKFPNVGPLYQRYQKGYDLLFNVAGEISPFVPFQGDADCSTPFNLKFPTSYITSCTKTIIDATDFADLVSKLLNPLPTALAKYYNSDLTMTDEWFQLSWNIPEVARSSIPLRVELIITHKSFGSRLYPENEIISVSTSVSTTNVDSFNKEGLLNDKLVFYFTTRFVSVDVDSSKENNIISRLSTSLSNYFAYQTDSVPLRMLAVAVALFAVATLGILVQDQGKPDI